MRWSFSTKDLTTEAIGPTSMKSGVTSVPVLFCESVCEYGLM